LPFSLPSGYYSSSSSSGLQLSSSTTEETLKTSDASSSNVVEPYDVLNKARGLDKYDPSSFESEVYRWWELSGCFQPDAKPQPPSSTTDGISHQKKPPYVLPMPPPNVTGRLHMGHAIFVALQDVLARFHRMRGRPVLWLPGIYSILAHIGESCVSLHHVFNHVSLFCQTIILLSLLS
jgi:hypothetical protein